jgi:predicted regulator of Ras-like GTPase activity (Roadblock/LC7/MglB family)
MAEWYVQILSATPLVSAAAWLTLAALQVYRDRWHTWTETFFLFSCFFAGLYAIGDWLFFGAKTDNLAKLAALVSLTGLTLAVNFFLLFTLVYVDRMRRKYWAVMAITVAVLLMMWSASLDVLPPSGQGGLRVPVYNSTTFGIYLVYVIVYSVIGIWNLYRLYRIVKESGKGLARRAAGLLVTFSMVTILGLATNGFLGITRNETIPPPFSTLLILVAASAYYTLYPVGRERISEAIRRFQSRLYDVRGAFLIYEDGTLIGAEVQPGEKVIDEDLFSATLDVIQNFMRTSFPTLRGQWLRTITHGDYTLIIERGKHTYVVLVIEGVENDQLRRQMRDTLLKFEAQNRAVLSSWRGVPSEATGTKTMLMSLLED